MGNIFCALHAADIPVIPLKCACLAEVVYDNLALAAGCTILIISHRLTINSDTTPNILWSRLP